MIGTAKRATQIHLFTRNHGVGPTAFTMNFFGIYVETCRAIFYMIGSRKGAFDDFIISFGKMFAVFTVITMQGLMFRAKGDMR